MPLPLGHAAIGITAVDLLPGRKSVSPGWKEFLFAAILANLPDFDILIGLIFNGSGSTFHRGVSHSLLFALIMGFFAANAHKLWSKIPAVGFLFSFTAIFSHTIGDMLFTTTPVSLFWPLEVYISQKSHGWLDIINAVLFEVFRDASIIMGCAVIFFVVRLLRMPTTTVLQEENDKPKLNSASPRKWNRKN